MMPVCTLQDRCAILESVKWLLALVSTCLCNTHCGVVPASVVCHVFLNLMLACLLCLRAFAFLYPTNTHSKESDHVEGARAVAD